MNSVFNDIFSFLVLVFIFLVMKPISRQCTQWSCQSVSCFNSIDATDAGMSLAPASDHPLASLSSATLEPATQPSLTSGTSQHQLLSLALYYRLTMNSKIPQNYSTKVKAAFNCLVNCISQPPTPTPLGFYFHHNSMTLEGMGHSFRELAKKN